MYPNGQQPDLERPRPARPGPPARQPKVPQPKAPQPPKRYRFRSAWVFAPAAVLAALWLFGRGGVDLTWDEVLWKLGIYNRVAFSRATVLGLVLVGVLIGLKELRAR